jgi:hypothetical protein
MANSILQTVWLYALANPAGTIAAVLATLASVVALTFVFRRDVTPSSSISERGDSSAEERTDEVIRLIIKKEFVRDIVIAQLKQTAARPRFSFKEFIFYAMPAALTLALLAVTINLIYTKPEIVLDPNKGLPPFITQAFLAIIGYYFGTAASKA